MNRLTDYFGTNAGYVEELYERYRQNPLSVDAETRKVFESWQPGEIRVTAPPQAQAGADVQTIIGAGNYIQAIRTYGHLNAKLDPLGHPPTGDPLLDLRTYQLTEEDLRRLPATIIESPLADHPGNAYEVVEALQRVYSASIGYEYGHIRSPEERNWLRNVAESGEFRPPVSPVDPIGLLKRLTVVEGFEQFLHRFFPGKTRFSIEGLDMMVPMLDEIVERAADAQICMIMIGMAHRGRLNVLAHVLGKPYAQILAEFKDPHLNYTALHELGWTGDVTYHKGALHTVREGESIRLIVSMAPNPSHLEHVNPIVQGMAHSADSGTEKAGPPIFYPDAALPVLIHGDASFPGEGVTAEALNLSKLDGYSTGGTVHIIANNQLGYTTTPHEGRSTLYASDLAKGFEIPIMHVNADDPVACLETIRTAFAYRQRFHKDFLIDLVGYRRYGHNEGDEPSFTQPILYDEIESHPSVRAILGKTLRDRQEIEAGLPDQLMQEQIGRLQQIYENLKPEEEIVQSAPAPTEDGAMSAAMTGVSLSALRDLNQALLTFPGDFSIHRKLKRSVERRRQVLEDPNAATIDWATAEELSMASILSDGIAIRLTGQDVERGTFSQRHAVFHDVQNGQTYIPLQCIPQAKASFDIHNSPLSENAALGFEYGYNVFYPLRLVIWEAQYGDFINAGQAMIDEFISSARAKWQQNPSLVLLLPHGYEGQGPDHSSARPERFLQLGTTNSMRIVNCTTAAQYFHLLRLQAALLAPAPLPLVIFTPKSLLRHPKVYSTPRDLAEGQWMPVLDDPEIENPDAVRRIILCTGKIAIDLLSSELKEKNRDVAILRIEQLAPFPDEEIRRALDRYTNATEVVWVQEEPENMGAWDYIQPRISRLLKGRMPIYYLGRAFSPSPAEGSSTWHMSNQSSLIAQSFDSKIAEFQRGEIVHKG